MLCTFPHDWVFDYVEQLDGLPEKVKGLVLVSATPRMMEDENWKGMSERRLAALRLGTKMMFRDDPSPMYDERNMERGLDYLKATDLRLRLLSIRESGESAKRWNFPVFIFQSERDGIVRPSNVEFLKRVFPQAKVTMVPGNEHVLPIKVPELIDAAVFDIIGTNEPEA